MDFTIYSDFDEASAASEDERDVRGASSDLREQGPKRRNGIRGPVSGPEENQTRKVPFWMTFAPGLLLIGLAAAGILAGPTTGRGARKPNDSKGGETPRLQKQRERTTSRTYL